MSISFKRPVFPLLDLERPLCFAARRSLALPVRAAKIFGRATLRGAANKEATLTSVWRPRSLKGFGICLELGTLGYHPRAIIRARENGIRCSGGKGSVPVAARAPCLKGMDFRGYFALRLPRGVMVAPEILDLFV